MKVLVIFSFRNSLQTWKDVGNLDREMKFYKYLAEKYNFKFYFLTYGEEHDKKIAETYSKSFTVLPIYEYTKKSNYKIVTFLQSLIIPFKIKGTIKNLDVVKSNQLTAGWTGLICKLFFSKPLYVRTGYDAYIFSKNEKKSKFKQILFFLLTQIVIIFSDRYTVTSNSDLKFITSKYFLPRSTNLSISPNWVNYIDPSSLDIMNRNNKSILSVGRLEEQKNYQFIIEALSNSEFELNIIGTGSMKEELINLANSVNTNLEIINNISNSELMEVYKDYKYFILSSNFEGNPKVLLEAMSAGCIPIVSNIQNNSEIVDDGYNGFLFDLDNKGKDVLKKLLQDDLDFTMITNNATNTVKSRFSLEKIASQEVSDLQNLTSRS